MKEEADLFSTFYETVTKLRDPVHGCPWDKEQNHQSLIKYLIEETFEAIGAIEDNDSKHLMEELGDVLLQVVLHSVIAKENNHFTITDVISHINEKMIRRHPHVFSNEKVSSVKDVKDNWQKIKKQEKDKADQNITFNNKYIHHTALNSSLKIGNKTEELDFDWPGPEQVMEKVEEELNELKKEISVNNNKKIKEEYGDFLFTVAQLGRHLGINPENELRKANKKFINRYNAMEILAKKENNKLENLTNDQKNELWNKVKKQS